MINIEQYKEEKQVVVTAGIIPRSSLYIFTKENWEQYVEMLKMIPLVTAKGRNIKGVSLNMSMEVDVLNGQIELANSHLAYLFDGKSEGKVVVYDFGVYCEKKMELSNIPGKVERLVVVVE